MGRKIEGLIDPGTGAPFEDWPENRHCLGVDTARFFPNDVPGVIQAQEICAECPCQIDCLRYALDHNIEHGIWGGVSERQRRLMRRKRRLARSAAQTPDPANQNNPGMVAL